MFRPRRFHRARSLPLWAALSSIACVVVVNQQDAAPDPGAGEAAAAPAYQYPAARRGDTVDDYHGTKVADPYRWMEDIDSDEVRAWIEAENVVTDAYLAEIDERARIKSRLEKLWNYERWGTPYEDGGKWFVSKNDGLQNQSVIYWSDSPDGEWKVLFDPNTWSEDGTVSLSGRAVSRDGKYVAYSKSKSGSDWKTWYVRDIATGKDLPDVVEWSKFTGASWAPDGSGFYYGGFEAPKEGDEYESVNVFQKLRFHRLGEPSESDAIVYESKEHEEREFAGWVTDDGRFLMIEVSEGTDTRDRVYFKELPGNPKAKKRRRPKNAPKLGSVVKLLDDFDASYDFIDNEGHTFYFKTDLDAPRGRVIAIDVTKPERANWKEVIPQGEHTLRGVSRVGDRLICSTMADATSKVTVYDLNGKLERAVDLPGIGSAGGFGGDRDSKFTFYSFSSFTRPTTIYRYDPASGESAMFREPKLPFDPDAFVTEQVFYSSADGTRVPMFITSKKGTEKNGKNPTYLYAYGGFNISLMPSYSPTNMAWLEMGGVYAQPNLRGGGEYGETWHQGGMKLNKQNVFDDFAAAAEYLIDQGWTETPKLGIGGRSNGGLLVGASVTQRPELFGAALGGVGVMDMLRFHKFTIGWAWTSDYGSSDDPEQFAALHKYSPVHNAREAEYPPTLIYTADHDDRVVPSHSFKFAAAMQHAQKSDAPVLIRVDTKAGHGGGKPTAKRIEEWADLWGFLVRELEVTLPDGY
jgi:prolyl oligopeptidase